MRLKAGVSWVYGPSGDQARTRHLLVVLEVASWMMLMITASLLLRSFWDFTECAARIQSSAGDGSSDEKNLPIPIDPEDDIYFTVAQRTPFFRKVVRRVKTLPGVEEVALGDSSSVPLDHRQRGKVTLFPLIFEGRSTQMNKNTNVNSSLARIFSICWA